MRTNVNEQLSDLTYRLNAAFADRLVSAILYGSAVIGDWDEHSSDLNVLCVLNRLSPQELAKSEPIFRWWRSNGNPPPLLLTEEEVRTSTDCFPIEFHDMKDQRRVLCGVDIIADLEIDRCFYRAQVEHELRAKQIRLRQRAAELLSSSQRLSSLLADSVSTFCVLGRHALILSGREARWRKTGIVSALEEAMKMPLPAASAILTLRTERKGSSQRDAVSLLEKYLMEVDALVRFVDALDR